MAHVVSWDAKENGALAVIAGSPWTVLTAYDLYADEFGNSWASSRPDKKRPGALNTTTGLSHSAIAGKGGARAFLESHGAIEALDHELVKQMYASKPKKPPANVTVWHITCVVKQCGDAECTCSHLLHVAEANLYHIHTSTESDMKLIPDTTTTEVNTSKKTKGADAPARETLYEDAWVFHSAMEAYRDVMGFHVTRNWRDRVAKAVPQNVDSLTRWHTLLDDWQGHGYSPRNIKDMLDAFEAGGIAARGRQQAPVVTPSGNYESPEAEYTPPIRLVEVELTEEQKQAKADRELWDLAYGQMALSMPREAFDTWVKSCYLVQRSADTFIFETRVPQAYEWLTQRLHQKFVDALTAAAKTPVEVVFTLASVPMDTTPEQAAA